MQTEVAELAQKFLSKCRAMGLHETGGDLPECPDPCGQLYP